MKAYKVIIFSLFIIAFFLEVFNIYLSNKVSTDSFYASKARDEIYAYEEQNASLKAEILYNTALSNISERATKLGFVEQKNYISLYTPVQVAVKK